MTRLLAVMRWRQLRWVACLAIVPALWACNSQKLAKPNGTPSAIVKNRFQQSVNRDLDLLFMVDDSSSMSPLQTKMRDQLPAFMQVLKDLPGGLPNLHVAVVTSSLGAGKFNNVNGCMPGTQGNTDGLFQHSPACTGLNSGESYIKSVRDASGAMMQNFSGNIEDVFSCIANVGDRGCGFEHQFESVRLALQRSFQAGDPNAGFVRDSAYLAVVMITNEDDCSVPADSDLFDPGMSSVKDPYGGLQSYRCNEFGHTCDAPGLPHNPPDAPMTMSNCRSKEDGRLVRVSEFTDFLKSLKASTDQILVAALAGPVTPYKVTKKAFMLSGGTEDQPTLEHSCMQNSGEYADPAVRIKQWLDGFGSNAVLQSICASDFRNSMVKIAQTIGKALGAQCVSGNFALKENGEPDCQVTQRQYDAARNPQDKPVRYCGGNTDSASVNDPCWRFEDSGQCPGTNPPSKLLAVCYAPDCKSNKPSTTTDALVACAIQE